MKGLYSSSYFTIHWLKESLNTRLKKEEDDTVYKDSKKVQLLKEGTLISFLIVILYIPDKKEYTEEYMEMESVPFVKGIICSTNYIKKNPASVYCKIYISVFPNPTIGTIKPKNFIFSFKLPETNNIAIYLCNPNIKITYTFLDKQGRNIPKRNNYLSVYCNRNLCSKPQSKHLFQRTLRLFLLSRERLFWVVISVPWWIIRLIDFWKKKTIGKTLIHMY